MRDWGSATILGAAGIAAAALAAQPAVAEAWRFHDEQVLGTRLNVVVVAEDEAVAHRAAVAARAEIERLDGVLNSRRAGSELFQLNQSDRAKVSPDLYAVIDAAERWRAQTGGAYDGRMGAALGLWRGAIDSPPSREALAQAVEAAKAPILLDAHRQGIAKAPGVVLALDGLAKGYIVDRALQAARAAAPAIKGLMVDIGGDMRCWGAGPGGGRWDVGISDPARPGDDAECVAIAHLGDAAIATSGRGPRDRIVDGVRYSPTLSPADGWPVQGAIAATVIAKCAADADALATAFMVMPPHEAIGLANRTPGVAARILAADGQVHASERWRTLASEPPARLIKAATPGMIQSKVPPELRWPSDWGVEMIYIAPDKNESERAADFRTPYMALWITDAANNPIRTIVMVGKEPNWQRDNFVWWNIYKGQTVRMVSLRSEATALSGRYSLFWRGIDDAWDSVPVGDYILHIETSQEHGKHSYRTLPLKIGKAPFSVLLPATKEGGGLQISYGLKR
jgi:thiamine biosynthesis lipoprotein